MHFCTCAECGIKKTKFVKNQTGEGMLDKLTDKLTKSGVTGSPWHVDFKKGIELIKEPETFSSTNKQSDEDWYKNARNEYEDGKHNGYKGSWKDYAKSKGWIKKKFQISRILIPYYI